jgi:hypothetical protein
VHELEGVAVVLEIGIEGAIDPLVDEGLASGREKLLDRPLDGLRRHVADHPELGAREVAYEGLAGVLVDASHLRGEGDFLLGKQPSEIPAHDLGADLLADVRFAVRTLALVEEVAMVPGVLEVGLHPLDLALDVGLSRLVHEASAGVDEALRDEGFPRERIVGIDEADSLVGEHDRPEERRQAVLEDVVHEVAVELELVVLGHAELADEDADPALHLRGLALEEHLVAVLLAVLLPEPLLLGRRFRAFHLVHIIPPSMKSVSPWT